MGLFKSGVLHRRNVLLVMLFAISAGWSQTPVQKYGQLKVQGNKILDQNNSPAQLRGMSLFWSQWIGKYYNYNAVKWLRDDWCSNVVRAAMAVDNDGYATYPDEEKAKVFAVVDAAIQLGIYVIVDFHVHEANLYKTEAKTFFAEVAQKYGNHPNIIYEIWNEPLDVSWSGVIKPYHNEVVATIRQYDPDNIIICGTRLWSQRVDEAANDPVTGTNIAYTLHYYANTHGQTYRDYCSTALGKNAAVFVTEYGTCSADGGGTVNVGESNNWWTYLDQHKISYCNWSLADKVEAASALKPNASINGNWISSDLTTSGTLVRNYYKSKCDFTIPTNITASLTAPVNNTSLSLGATVSASVTASTTEGTITKVSFYVDDVLVGSDTLAPYALNITALTIGKHTINAVVFNSINESVSTNTANVVVETPVYKTSTAPTVDGTIDALWSNANVPAITMNKAVSGTVSSATDLSGTFKTLWDNTYLYILGNITDNTKVNDSPESYNDDGIEIFVDINNDKASAYAANDVQYTFAWNDGTIISSNPTGRITTGISYTMLAQTGGYVFEARIPWTTLKGTPVVGQKVGFDFHINDDDDGDGRDAKIAWNSSSDDTWQNPSLFGTVVLQDLIPCPLPSGVGTIVGSSALCTGPVIPVTL
jgi:endoglucanase